MIPSLSAREVVVPSVEISGVGISLFVLNFNKIVWPGFDFRNILAI
jgi:hypothetical protein